MVMGYVGSSMIHNASWWAAQQNQPWYPAYRADLERQAADNAELRAKVSQLDLEVAAQRAAGNVAQANSLPPGVNPALAISPEAVVAVTPDKPDNGTPVWVPMMLTILVVAVGSYLLMRR